MPALPAPVTTPAPASEPRCVRVLTVDDQAIFRATARALVEHTPGFEVVAEAASGEAALEAARAARPDLVILDVRIPGIDGIETARRLSEQDATSVIALVSSADLRPLGELVETCGAVALVRKQWLTPRLLRGLWVAHRRR